MDENTNNGHLIDNDGQPVTTFQRFEEIAPARFSLPGLAWLWREYGPGCIDFAQHPDFDVTMAWLDNQTREITLCDIIWETEILDYDSPEEYLLDMYGFDFDDQNGFTGSDGLASYIVYLSHE